MGGLRRRSMVDAPAMMSIQEEQGVGEHGAEQEGGAIMMRMTPPQQHQQHRGVGGSALGVGGEAAAFPQPRAEISTIVGHEAIVLGGGGEDDDDDW